MKVDKKMETMAIFDNMNEWDFEKYASVILYLNTYYEKCMSQADRIALAGNDEIEYYTVPVTVDLLRKLEFDETLDEFYGEAEIMQEEMLLDEDCPLLKVVRQGEGLTLYVDPVMFSTMADLPELEAEEMLPYENEEI